MQGGPAEADTPTTGIGVLVTPPEYARIQDYEDAVLYGMAFNNLILFCTVAVGAAVALFRHMRRRSNSA